MQHAMQIWWEGHTTVLNEPNLRDNICVTAVLYACVRRGGEDCSNVVDNPARTQPATTLSMNCVCIPSGCTQDQSNPCYDRVTSLVQNIAPASKLLHMCRIPLIYQSSICYLSNIKH
jgi:hypothetical protein